MNGRNRKALQTRGLSSATLLLLLVGGCSGADPRDIATFGDRPNFTNANGQLEYYYDDNIPMNDVPRIAMAADQHWMTLSTRIQAPTVRIKLRVNIVEQKTISMPGGEPRGGVPGTWRGSTIWVCLYDERGMPTIPDLTHQLVHALGIDPDGYHQDTVAWTYRRLVARQAVETMWIWWGIIP